MSQLSKNELKAENQLQFPNNNNGAITPSRLRAFNVDVIDSTVNQTDFTNFSGSVVSDINALEADVLQLQNFSASLSGGFVTEGELAAATGALEASIATKVDTTTFNAYTQSINAFTASQIIVDTAFNTAITNLNQATASLFASASEGLVTASFAAQTLTFTKGDGEQFSIFIPDQSGSTGNFATTGSNSFNGNQIVTGSVTITDKLGVNGGINIYTASINGIYIGDNPNWNPTSLGRIPGNGHLVIGKFALENFTHGDVNTAIGWNALKALRSGSVNMAIGPFAGRNLLGGDSNFLLGENAAINFVTGSYNFVLGSSGGNSLVSGDYNVILGSNPQGAMATGSGCLLIGRQQPADKLQNNVDNQVSITYGTDLSPRRLLYKSGSEASNLYLYGGLEIENTLTHSLAQGFVLVGDANNRTSLVATSSFGGGGSIDTGSFATTGSNTFTGTQTISNDSGANSFRLTAGGLPVSYGQTAVGNLEISQSGSVWVRTDPSPGRISHFWTSSMQNDVLVSNGRISITGQTSDGPVWLLGNSGSLVIGNNAQGPTYANLSHITSSAPNTNTNIIIKHNNLSNSLIISGSRNIIGNPDTLTAGRVSLIGNGNIGVHAGGIVSLTGSAASVAGNRPTVNGNFYTSAGGSAYFITSNQSPNGGAHTYSGNIGSGNGYTINALGSTGTISMQANIGPFFATINAASRSIAEINAGATGSNNVNMNANIGAGGATITYNGPVSQSAAQIHAINSNFVDAPLTMNLQSGSRGYTITQNLIQGAVTINDNTVFAPQLGSNTLMSSNITTGFTANNRASSSFSINNNIGGGFILSTELDTSLVNPLGARTSIVTNNNINGTSHNIYFSGSMGAVSGSRQFGGNTIGGLFNSASLVGDGSNRNIFATIIQGGYLNVTGSNPLTFGQAAINIGSAFFGRYNAEGIRASTAETIFAVGTGISSSLGLERKTGFLIDSGSNTFIEGTLNVSGATSLNGNLIVTGSLTASLATGFMYVGNSLGRTEAIPTASFTASLATNATDIVVNVKNTTGLQINKGTVVRIIGATGDNPLIATASWEDDSTSANTLGFVVNDIANDGFGRVMTQGTLLSVNTDPALGFAAGDILYLSSSGQYTNIKPPAPNHEVRLGQVLRAQQNNGSIYVLIQNGYELEELHDVNIITGSLANNDLLAYDSTTTQWTNKSAASLGILTTGSLNSGIAFATISQSGSAAVSQSIQFGVTGSMNGVSLVSGSQFQVADSGLYSLTISTQWVIDLTMDNVYLWVMKNGSNVLFSSQRQAYNGSFTIYDQANANDYYEFVFESADGSAILQASNSSGNRPATPCAIAAIQQIA